MDSKYLTLPKYISQSNKSTYGKILIIAGSKLMCGAAILSGLSSIKMGAGYLYIYSHIKNKSIIQGKIPEAIIYTYNRKVLKYRIKKLIKNVDSILIGPGIGKSRHMRKMLKYILKKAKCNVIIDADGLNILSKKIKYLNYNKKYPIILTPHIVEFNRLINNFNINNPCKFIKNKNIVLVLKNYYTCISSSNSNVIVNNPCPALSKAGQGDVLAGIISALVSSDMDVFNACVTGVYIHNRTGKYLEEKYGRESVLPTDVINNMYRIINIIRNEKNEYK